MFQKLKNKRMALIAKTKPVEKPKNKDRYVEGIGRRKAATARVRIYPSTSKPLKDVATRDEKNPRLISGGDMEVQINEKHLKDYFKKEKLLQIAISPLNLLSVAFKMTAKVSGGGESSQAEAVRLGLSRALNALNEKWRLPLKTSGYLRRDSREVERKKPGFRKARRPQQWKKR